MQRSTLIRPTRKLFRFSTASSSSPILKFRPSIGLALREKSTGLKGGYTRPPDPSKTHKNATIDIDKLLDITTIASKVAHPRRRFTPSIPDTKPLDIFSLNLTSNTKAPVARFINNTDPSQILIFCNGIHRKPPAPGGLGVCFSFKDNLSASLIPNEDGPGYTYNSANLQAAITALQLRDWRAEGFTKLVVACNVPYIVDGVSGKVVKWEKQGWRSAGDVPIANRGFWVDLLSTIKSLEKGGVDVQFWTIQKGDNLAVELSEIGMEPEPEVKKKAVSEKMKKRRDPKRQMIGFLLIGGAGIMVGLAAIKFGY